MRKYPLVNNQVYHIISRSIAGYKIFNNRADFSRFVDMLDFYQKKLPYKYSIFTKLTLECQNEVFKNHSNSNNPDINIVTYCIMPTHIHLTLKQIEDDGISRYMNKILNSYSRYFNTKYKRKGPLWESRFKNILVESDEQLLHLSRYIHLNPVSANLVDKPEQWEFSSYNEYLGKTAKKICLYNKVLEIKPAEYRKFVEDRIDYQKEISKIKNLILEDYSG